jgi:hypothetical protein
MSDIPQSFSVEPALKQRVVALYTNMAKRLGVKQAPKIVFTQNQANASDPFGKTAYYDQMARLIRVYTSKRHPTDILRSFAHELIHHWQNEHGALPNSKSANQGHYAQVDPILRKREMEAYLLGNMLFRDWQDEQRYGPVNENIKVNNPKSVKRAIKQLLFDLVKERVVTVNECKVTKSEIKSLIRERIAVMLEARHEIVAPKDSPKKEPKVHGTYADWLKQNQDNIRARKARAAKYYEIGFPLDPEFKDDDMHFCWYWDAQKKELVKAQGGAHLENFGPSEPYINYRGRYDIRTKELSLTLPEYGEVPASGDAKKDLPLDMLKALKKTFPGHKLFYFPFKV